MKNVRISNYASNATHLPSARTSPARARKTPRILPGNGRDRRAKLVRTQTHAGTYAVNEVAYETNLMGSKPKATPTRPKKESHLN